MEKTNTHVLFDAFKKYAETKDSSLITEEVYIQYTRYIQFIAKKYNFFNTLTIDEKVSIVNDELWKRIKLYDESKGTMGTFLSVVIKTAFLMEYRRRNLMKNKTDNLVSFDDVMLTNDSYGRDIRREEYEGKEDDEKIEFEYLEVFNLALDEFIDKQRDDIKEKYRGIILMNFNDYDQKYIGKKYGYSQSYISRIVSNFYKYIKNNKKRYLEIDD